MIEYLMYASFFCCLGFGLWCAADEVKQMLKGKDREQLHL